MTTHLGPPKASFSTLGLCSVCHKWLGRIEPTTPEWVRGIFRRCRRVMEIRKLWVKKEKKTEEGNCKVRQTLWNSVFYASAFSLKQSSSCVHFICKEKTFFSLYPSSLFLLKRPSFFPLHLKIWQTPEIETRFLLSPPPPPLDYVPVSVFLV